MDDLYTCINFVLSESHNIIVGNVYVYLRLNIMYYGCE